MKERERAGERRTERGRERERKSERGRREKEKKREVRIEYSDALRVKNAEILTIRTVLHYLLNETRQSHFHARKRGGRGEGEEGRGCEGTFPLFGEFSRGVSVSFGEAEYTCTPCLSVLTAIHRKEGWMEGG